MEFPSNGVCVLIFTRGGVFIGPWKSSTDLVEVVTGHVVVGRPGGIASTAFLHHLGLPLVL
jgi:hypothetical protein